MKFVLDSGEVQTIMPKVGIPGTKLDTSTGGSFRVASCEVIPNLRAAKLVGTGALSNSPVPGAGQAADITMALAVANEMLREDTMVIMQRTGRTYK